MISETDAAYIAGLFDGEGHVSYKQYMRQRKHHNKPYPTWQIRLEISMTDEAVLKWIHNILKVGTVGPKKVRPGRLPQWRWRCSHRDALAVANEIIPFARVKNDHLKKIIDHYEIKKNTH